MAQYDGSIRIKTEIDAKSVGTQLSALENRIVKTSDKIASLRSKMDVLKDAKIPTQEYAEISVQIEKAEQKFNKFLEKQEQMQREGKDSGAQWQRLNDQIDEVGNEIRFAQGELQDLVDTGRAFTLGSSTEEFAKLSQQLQYAENDLSVLNQKHEVLELKQKKNIDSYKRLGDTAKKALNSVGNMLKKINSLVDSFAKRIKSTFLNLGKSATAANKGFSGISLSLKNILKYGFGIRSLYTLANKLRSAITEGFGNLLDYSKSLENSINGIKATALTLKNAFAAAFSPFVEIALPYIQTLLDYMVQLVNIAGQFFAAITGRKTYIRAIKQTTDALEEETAAMNKQLGPLDKLNNLSSQQAGGKDTGTGGAMFEEVPIESEILEAAEKIKDILSKLFEPLKKAWEQEGQFVIDSWKYALEEVWKLIKDIGRDFMIVWNEDETVAVLANILHIIGDIGLVVGNLARNFREAWNTNQVGLEILRNIRDVIGIIVQHIRNMADATVEWADKLNFYPILDAFKRFLDSIKPVVDAIWGIIEDFYVKVILPLSKWTIEKGLPDLLQVFIDFNNKVDWESLRKNLAEFWEHLEPFAETVGEGLILFIRKVSDVLANFLNSQQFKDFLVTIENWMDSVSPEDVADALEMIAKGLIALKVALIGFSAISAITGILTTIKTFLSFFGVGGSTIAGGIGETTTALGGLKSVIADVTIATTAAVAVVEPFKDKMMELAEENGAQAQTVADAKDKYDGWFGSLRLVKDEVHGLLLGMQGLPTTIASSVGAVDALNKAMEAVANGTIYTDAQMQKMQNTWGFTDEDLEMLRQEMLDTNPALRDLADGFPTLANASAESLSQISYGLEAMEQGILDVDNVTSGVEHRLGELTPTAEAFFASMGDGSTSIADINYAMETGEQVIDGYVASLENTSAAVEQFSDDVVEASTSIGEGLTAGMENIDTDSPATGFFNKFVASIKSIFGIHSPADSMKPFGENILLGVVEGFKSQFESFTAPITQLFTQISSKFTSGMQSVKNVWTNAWNALPNTVKSIINSIMSMVSSFISGLSSAFSKVSSFGSKVSSAFKGGTSTYSMQGFTQPVSPVVAALSNVEIPAYATGQVIPRTMKQHLAILGDNTQETEVVSPLSTIEQAVENAIIKNGGFGGGDTYLHLVVECEGHQLLELMRKLDKQFYKQNGRHAFSG